MQKIYLGILFAVLSSLSLASFADEARKSKSHEECAAYINRPSDYDTCRWGPPEYTGPAYKAPASDPFDAEEFAESAKHFVLKVLPFGVLVLLGVGLFAAVGQSSKVPHVHFENPRTGQLRSGIVGFSWTTLLFGPFPMLLRGNWKRFVFVGLVGMLTIGLSNIVFAFLVNRMHLQDLVSDGFKVKNVDRGTPQDVGKKLGMELPILDA